MKKIVLFGELLLRLKSPFKERFLQSDSFDACFGGAEANVAVSLSHFKKNTLFVTALPKNDIGFCAKNSLRYFGVDVFSVFKDGRMGIYFLEQGSCQRPSKVIYDRENSVFSKTSKDEYDWDLIFKDADYFHITGVTMALSSECADCGFKAVDEARKRGVKVSVDLNYRKKLWNYGKSASKVMSELVKKADILIANEEDIQHCLDIPLEDNGDFNASYKKLCTDVKAVFPNLQIIAVTIRNSFSADKNEWSAFLLGKTGFYESTHYSIENITERVGAGDAFAAGLIYSLSENFDDEKNALEFACAAGCIKHSVPGDFNLCTKEEVIYLMNGNSNGRIMR